MSAREHESRCSDGSIPPTVTPELRSLQEVVVGRYSIERELGRGGMGIVCLAHDVALERPVAIKLLPFHFASDERMRARFVREARTAARLSHPNIVPIHSVEEHADVVFFVMSFVDGETLSTRVRRAGPLTPSDGITLIQELAWALAYAHSAGVIHRDVKPDNVLIDRASGRAMLTDFGIARVTDGSAATGIGEIVGTPQFLSPEQASGMVVDGRSDLYSLGVTAFYALTGRLPFEAPTAVGVLGMHLTRQPPPVATVRESLPPKLCAAVDRCLAKDPSNRFPTGEQLADVLAEARGANMQIAPAVRSFLRDRSRAGHEIALLYSAVLYLGTFAHMPFVQVAGPLSLLAAASVTRLFQTARRLSRAGYGFDDVRIAIQAEADARREEIGLTHSDEARLRGTERLRVAGVAAVATGLLAVPAALRRASGSWSGLGVVFGAALAIAGVVLLTRAGAGVPRHQRQGQWGRWLDHLWQGRIGRWFFTLAKPSDESRFARLRRRIGMASAPAAKALPAGAVNVGEPTEVVIARAADDLLDALPSSAREQLGAGRDVIERLRTHIATLRRREEQLEAALAQAGEPFTATSAPDAAGLRPTLIARRIELTSELEHARRDAATRRASAVAALENIRLQLLRLRTGLGSPANLTADLEAAREIERQIVAAIEVSEMTKVDIR
jgi:eukaryotic-like serine/threonine-protein kinase